MICHLTVKTTKIKPLEISRLIIMFCVHYSWDEDNSCNNDNNNNHFYVICGANVKYRLLFGHYKKKVVKMKKSV